MDREAIMGLMEQMMAQLFKQACVKGPIEGGLRTSGSQRSQHCSRPHGSHQRAAALGAMPRLGSQSKHPLLFCRWWAWMCTLPSSG